jgi:regulatory protein
MDKKKWEAILKRAQDYCSKAEKSVQDMLQKLQDWGLDLNQAVEMVEVLKKQDYINHARYAQAFTNDKFRFNKWGLNKIRVALLAKRIESEYINKAIKAIDIKEYEQMVVSVLADKRQEIEKKETDSYKIKAKLSNFALSRGYEPRFIERNN